tara:strand:+ start:394 stop:600 length:207 start_codon:yes stop_codon:yes gene_type:complete
MNSLNIKDWGQLNVLEVAMDHMEEHLNDLDLDPEYDCGIMHRARLDNTIKLQGALAQLRSQMLNAMEK